jgi:hypothetical protein
MSKTAKQKGHGILVKDSISSGSRITKKVRFERKSD